MFLPYTEFPSYHSHLTVEWSVLLFDTSTVRPTPNQIVISRVRAIADGALRRNRKNSNPTKNCIWSKQRRTLYHTVSWLDLILGKKDQYRLGRVGKEVW